MKLLLQHNAWSCLPTAFAMALDVLPKEIMECCGHDGSEIIWPDLPEPRCRRAFSIHEMIDYCLSQLVYPVEIDANPSYGPDDEHLLEIENRLDDYTLVRPGVFVGEINGKRHAVAWDYKTQKIFDPDGCQYEKERFNIYSFFVLF